MKSQPWNCQGSSAAASPPVVKNALAAIPLNGLSAPLSVVPWINSRRCSAASSATNVDMMLLLLLLFSSFMLDHGASIAPGPITM